MILGPFHASGVCTFCGSSQEVICYPVPRAELSPTLLQVNGVHTAETHPCACPDCCGEQDDGHEYGYDPGARQHTCDRCGAEPPDDWVGYGDPEW